MPVFKQRIVFLKKSCIVHLRWWKSNGGFAIQGVFQQLVAKNVVEVLGHDSLLLNAAVVLHRQDDWIFWHLDGEEEGWGGKRVSL